MALQSKAFSDIVTFSRSSGGGRFNAAGQYEWLAANQPRIDYDPVTLACKGLLIEEQRTNLLKQSSDFTTTEWIKQRVNVMTGAQLAPDHSAAQLISPTTEFNSHGIVSGPNGLLALAVGQTASIAASIYFKPGGHRYIAFSLMHDSPRCATATVDTQEGVVTYSGDGSNLNFNIVGTPTIESTANGWSRLTVVAAATADVALNVRVYVTFSNISALTNPGGSPPSFSGDGTSGVYLWGVQLEAGAFPTSYIPTTAAQVTRAASDPLIPVLSQWFNSTAGTFVIEHDAPSGRHLLSSGANVLATSQGAGKLVVAYDASGSYVSHSGAAYVAGPALPFDTTLRLMRAASALSNAHCAKFRYYPRKLSQEEVAAA